MLGGDRVTRRLGTPWGVGGRVRTRDSLSGTETQAGSREISQTGTGEKLSQSTPPPPPPSQASSFYSCWKFPKVKFFQVISKLVVLNSNKGPPHSASHPHPYIHDAGRSSPVPPHLIPDRTQHPGELSRQGSSRRERAGRARCLSVPLRAQAPAPPTCKQGNHRS